jgi:PAT family beta-lactamase induction signal transducer AmpG
MWLAAIGKDYGVMVLAVAFENLAGGMGTAAFVALLMAMCDKRFTASQFALLSALAAVGRVYVGPASGYMVEAIGWTTFFGFTFLAALPGLVLLYLMRRNIELMHRA